LMPYTATKDNSAITYQTALIDKEQFNIIIHKL
jgi:hypothetical protein